MESIEPASQYAIEWWKNRHELVYFPAMEQHKDWCLYDTLPPWFLPVQATDIALEIGCGYGQWMAPLAPLVRSVLGIDIHQSLVDKFNEHRAAGRIADNATMCLTDGLSLPAASGGYTLIYSISVYQHMPRATVLRYYQEAARILAPGGRAGFYFRADDGIGPYSKDISVDHTGDWSVGWSAEQITAAGDSVGWSTTLTDIGGALFATHKERN